MVAAMSQFTIKIQIANSALDVHLSDLSATSEAVRNYCCLRLQRCLVFFYIGQPK